MRVCVCVCVQKKLLFDFAGEMEKVYTLTLSTLPLRVIGDGLKNGKTSNTQFRVIIIIITVFLFYFIFCLCPLCICTYIYIYSTTTTVTIQRRWQSVGWKKNTILPPLGCKYLPKYDFSVLTGSGRSGFGDEETVQRTGVAGRQPLIATEKYTRVHPHTYKHTHAYVYR